MDDNSIILMPEPDDVTHVDVIRVRPQPNPYKQPEPVGQKLDYYI